MRLQVDKFSKATSSLFPIKMIAILEWAYNNVQQNIEQLLSDCGCMVFHCVGAVYFLPKESLQNSLSHSRWFDGVELKSAFSPHALNAVVVCELV